MENLTQYHERVIREAKERLKTMTPDELFIARCDASITKRTRPADPLIDPMADIDRPGQEEWK